MLKYLKIIVPFLSAVFSSTAGLMFGHIWITQTEVMIPLVTISLLPILLFILNLALGKSYVNKINQAKVTEMQGYMLRHRSEADQASGKLLRKLQRIRKLTCLYTLALCILAICSATLSGVLAHYQPALQPLGLLYSGLIFYAVYSRIRRKKALKFDENIIQLDRQEYPTLYATARRAADTLGCKGDIVIIVSLECDASIAKDKNRYILALGIVLLHILSEEELFSIFLHEFSHVSNKHRAAMREADYHKWLCNQDENHTPVLSFVPKLFFALDVRYIFNYMVYQYAKSVKDESEADRAMAEHSDVTVAVSALLKLRHYNMHFWESGVKDEEPLYAPEELSANYVTNKITEFKAAVCEREEFWNSLVRCEILANNATHPTLKMRMETLGVEKAETKEIESSEEYCEELKKALELVESRVFEDRKPTYAKDRAEGYVEPLARIEAWKEAGMPISAESYADIITDLRVLGRYSESEALCDRAITELDENSSMHAHFIKGCMMLYRYDEGGMEHIYHAIEKNLNYLDEGLTTVGIFCCYTGREKELLEYRERAARLAQKDKDEYSQISFLSKDDSLTKENLPEGMLDDILSFIHSVDCDIIENIYLVRKTVNENFFTSAFIIHFYGGTDAQRDEIMHKIFRFLDSYPKEWQFSLFDYFEYPEIKVEKIEGSLVYSKSKNKGE